MSTMRRAGLILTAALAASPLKAGGFKALAKELSAPARGAGIERVAVLSFSGPGGAASADGLNISERLTTHVVSAGKVQVVERGMLGRLMEEHRLARTGAVDPAAVKALGRILSVDGIVTGTFAEEGGRLVVHARLINVESGVIVSAGEREIERDWTPARPEAPVIGWPETKPAAPKSTPLPEENSLDPHDALAGDSCAESAEAEILESSILDLKARRWAILIKNGATRRSLSKNLDATISDPELKLDFLERVDAWSALGAVPALTASENSRVTELDQKAFWLLQNCPRTEVN